MGLTLAVLLTLYDSSFQVNIWEGVKTIKQTCIWIMGVVVYSAGHGGHR